MTTLVDTSVWYAALDRSDHDHHRATATLAGLSDVATTDHILIETHRLASYRLGPSVADAFLATVLGSGTRLEMVLRADLEHAARIRQTFADQRFSLVDCTSFSVMERLGITVAATLDSDFVIYRYGPSRDRAFAIQP